MVVGARVGAMNTRRGIIDAMCMKSTIGLCEKGRKAVAHVA